MCAEWNRNKGAIADLRVVLGPLNVLLQDETRGMVNGLFLEDYLTVLLSAVDFDQAIHPQLRRQVLEEAFLAMRGEGGQLSAERFLRTITNGERTVKAQNQRPFHVVTNLTVELGATAIQTGWEGRRVSIHGRVPNNYDRVAYDATAEQFVKETPSSFDAGIVIELGASSAQEAGYRALDAFHTLRGIWTLAVSQGRYYPASAGRQLPIGELIAGPLHTVHHPDGRAACPEFILYNQVYERPVVRHDFQKLWPRLHRRQIWTARRIRVNLRSARLSTWFRRYAEALDHADHGTSFLRLWALLEDLTLSGAGERQAGAIRRAAFVLPEFDVHYALLQHLQHSRNDLVHKESRSIAIGYQAMQTKRFVDALLIFHLDYGARFSDDELRMFLSQPADGSISRRTRVVVQAASRFRARRLSQEIT